MPITRRKRANPPDQPENNNHLADQTENAAEALAAESASAASNNGDDTGAPLEQAEEAPFAPMNPALPPVSNGDRLERGERQDSRLLLRAGDGLLAANCSAGHRSHRRHNNNQPRPVSLRRPHLRRRHTRFRCLSAICCTWPIIPAIPGQKKLAVCCCIACLKKAKPAVALAAGAVVPLPSPTTVGTHAAGLLARSASLTVRYAASGVSCSWLFSGRTVLNC